MSNFSMAQVQSMLAGASLVAAAAISLFFLRFWRKTGDRLFGYFSLAFLLLGVERLRLVWATTEVATPFYLIRLVAFLVILFAILDKNRKPDP